MPNPNGRQDESRSLTASTFMATAKRFLVVDDDVIFRDRLLKALASRGLEAHGAGSAAEARDVAGRVAPQAAIVDLRMPGGSGLDVVRDLAARNPPMRIVVLTGYGSIATAVEAVRRGAINYLTKPLDTDQILAAFEPASASPAPSGADSEPASAPPSLARVEWEHIQRTLTECDGNISRTARQLGLHRRSLQRKLGKLPPLD